MTYRVHQILAALDELGRATCTEIATHIGVDRNNVSRVVSRMCVATKELPQRVHIVDYVRDADGEKSYPRAVYARGKGENKPKPYTDPQAQRRRWRVERRTRVQGASVFTLGVGYNRLMQQRKEMQ